MRGRLFIVLGLAFAGPSTTLGADPVVGSPAPERAVVTAPAVVPPAQAVNERPRPVEKPKPAEKPQPVAETVRPPEVMPARPIEPSVPVTAPAPAPGDEDAAAPGEASAGGYSFGCLALSFAMLITGIAAGFLGRHFLSRHKLGGMTVRIGTWRGIP